MGTSYFLSHPRAPPLDPAKGLKNKSLKNPFFNPFFASQQEENSSFQFDIHGSLCVFKPEAYSTHFT